MDLIEANQELVKENKELRDRLKKIQKDFRILENNRTTDNNDYISLPMDYWIPFRKLVTENTGSEKDE